MQGTREHLLELDKKRTELEKEIFDLTDFLNSEGMPGVDGPLIDREGFPIPNVDLMAVRTARNRLIYKQNDLKNLMFQIEKEMSDYFKTENEKKQIEKIENKIQDKSEPIQIEVPSEDKETKFNNFSSSSIKIPFAYVGSVTDGSPAEEAGLRTKDGIINFDNKIYYGYYSNPLQKVAEIVKSKINDRIFVEVLRSNSDEQGFEKIEHVKLDLIPHQWSGQGLLGCKLNLEKN